MTDQQGEKPTPDLPAPLAAALGFIERLAEWAETIDAANDVLAAEGEKSPGDEPQPTVEPTITVTLPEGERLDYVAFNLTIDSGTLYLNGADGKPVAIYAPGRWASVERDVSAAETWAIFRQAVRSEAAEDARRPIEAALGEHRDYRTEEGRRALADRLVKIVAKPRER